MWEVNWSGNKRGRAGIALHGLLLGVLLSVYWYFRSTYRRVLWLSERSCKSLGGFWYYPGSTQACNELTSDAPIYFYCFYSWVMLQGCSRSFFQVISPCKHLNFFKEHTNSTTYLVREKQLLWESFSHFFSDNVWWLSGNSFVICWCYSLLFWNAREKQKQKLIKHQASVG